MLILSVRKGDYIMIDDDIRIEFIQDASTESLRVGIDAPQKYKIARGKLYEQKLMDDLNTNMEKLEELRQINEKATHVPKRHYRKRKVVLNTENDESFEKLKKQAVSS